MAGTVETAAAAAAWRALESHRDQLGATTLRDLFAREPDRFVALSPRLDDLLLDLSKCRLTVETSKHRCPARSESRRVACSRRLARMMIADRSTGSSCWARLT